MIMTQEQRDTLKKRQKEDSNRGIADTNFPEEKENKKKSYWTILAFLLLLFLVWLNISCARVAYVNESGEKFIYTRLGTQKLNGFEADVGDKKIKLRSSEGSSGSLAIALKNLSEKIP